MNGALVAGVALWLAAQPSAIQAGEFARVGSRALPEGLVAESAELADLGGDGVVELIVAAHTSEEAAASALLIHRTAGAQLSAALRLDLTPDVTAWTVGDVHADAGDELVLFTPTSAFAWRPLAPEDQRYVRLVSVEFLWQVKEDGELVHDPSMVRDVDGDGLEDLVLPEHGAFRIAFQARADGAATFERVQRVRVPAETSDWEGLGPELAGPAAVSGGSRGSGFSVSVEASSEDEDEGEAGTLLAVIESVPSPQWIDWDADGRVDLLAQTNERLHLWRQTPAGFAEDPTRSFELPVKVDRKRRLDASYVAFLRDLDGDRRGDCAIFAGDLGAKSVRTQLLAFLSKGGEGKGPERDPFGERGRPQDVLVLAGFVASADFDDLDGDGFPEIVARTVRPDLIDQLASAASEALDADLYVYANRGGRFERRPALSWRYKLPIKAFLPTVEFFGDATGDGLLDLMVRDEPESIRLQMTRREKEGWSILPRPLWETSLHEEALTLFARAPGRALDDLVILDPARVRLVRFGR